VQGISPTLPDRSLHERHPLVVQLLRVVNTICMGALKNSIHENTLELHDG